VSTRVCSKCGVAKPLDDDHFAAYAAGKWSGFRGACRVCFNAADAARRRRSRAAPQPAIPDDFDVRGVSTNVDANGVTKEQWIDARPLGESYETIQPAMPARHLLKGVSTLVDERGNVRAQWIKTRLDEEERLAALADAVQEIARPFAGAAIPLASPICTRDDLLAVYPMGDPHLGMLSWGRETGADFDLPIAERQLVGAVDHLVDLMPPAHRALIINLGDFFHTDSQANETARSHHQLDVDSRWAKILAVGIRTMKRTIERALTKHDEVTVICEIGNHDDHSAVMLALCLEQYYAREPRVRIDTSPAKFHWYRFDKNLIGTTHGLVKMTALAEIMAADRPEDWGETEHRYWYTGHVHHDRAIESRGGVLIESVRTLAARDSYAAGSGFRSGQDMKADVIHRIYGRVSRHVVGIGQLIAKGL
jgi:hypothetical protein